MKRFLGSVPRINHRRPKVRIGISPDPELLEWVDRQIGPGKRFATRTHAFEAGIICLTEQQTPLATTPTTPDHGR